MRRRLFVLATLLFAATTGTAHAQHPRLIVNASEIAELRSRASAEPWATMASQARTPSYYARALSPITYNDGIPDVALRLRDMTRRLGAASLAYLLESDDTALQPYVDSVLETLEAWPAIMATSDSVAPDRNHDLAVDGGSAAIAGLLALDIMYGSLSEAQRTQALARITPLADWLVETDPPWVQNNHGVLGTLARYNGNDTEFANRVESYRAYLLGNGVQLGELLPVYIEGSGYADARYGGDRIGKAYFMDIAEHAGVHSFYSEPRILELYRWLYAGAVTPQHRRPMFGDADASRPLVGVSFGYPAAYRVSRFEGADETLLANAAWTIAGRAPDATLLNYVLQVEALPSAVPPNSAVWPSGFASLWEHETTNAAQQLMGALWSPTAAPTAGLNHTHPDANSLHISALGHDVLRNVGYAGWQLGCGSHDWEWVTATAEANNTVTIAHAQHETHAGGGITESVLGDRFDYASGSSGLALGSARHQRNVVLVHPQDDAAGYFAVVDQIRGASAGAAIDVNWHPASTSAPTSVVADQSFDFAIHPIAGGTSDVALTIALATEPTDTTLPTGSYCSFDAHSFDGPYVDAAYTADSAGSRDVISILVPHDPSTPAATINRLALASGSGGTISFAGGAVVDTIVAGLSAGGSVNGVTVTAEAAIWRYRNDALTFYFVRRGTEFDDGATNPIGFSSSQPVSVHVRAESGTITLNAGATITFRAPELTSVQVDGASTTYATVAGAVAVTLSAGDHRLAFSTDPLPTCAALNTCDAGTIPSDAGTSPSDAAIVTDANMNVPDAGSFDGGSSALVPLKGSGWACTVGAQGSNGGPPILLILLGLGALCWRRRRVSTSR